MALEKRKPDWFDIGYAIKRLFVAECPYPLWLFIDIAIDQALLTVVEIFSPFNWKDIFRISTGRSYSHKGRAYFKGTRSDQASFRSKTGRFVFSLTAILDYASFRLLVYSAIEDGLYNWASQTFKARACDNPTSPYHAKSTRCLGGWPATDEWQIGPTYYPTGNPFHIQVGPILKVPPGWSGQIAMVFTPVELFSGLPVGCDCRIIDFISKTVYDETNNRDNVAQDHGAVIAWSDFGHQVNYEREIRVEVRFGSSGGHHRIVPEQRGMGYMVLRPGA